MTSNCVYSTNTYVKYMIQMRYRSDVHYVWCSEFFDSRTVGDYQLGAGIPPTSNPAEIYRDLKDAIRQNDRHNSKIVEQRASFIALSILWEKEGVISNDEKEEIIVMVEQAEIGDWRPLLYVIPRSALKRGRLQLVPPDRRANALQREYIIEDLKREEFDILEFRDA